MTDIPFFASKVRLGKNGVEEFCPLLALNEMEAANLVAMKAELMGSIQKGVEFVKK